MSRQKISPHKNSMYAPLRYEATRPYAFRLGRRCGSLSAMAGFAERRDFIMRELFPELQKELSSMGFIKGPGPGQSELSNIQQYASFLQAGRVIYDIHRALSKELESTEISTLTTSDLPDFGKAIYLHFGSGAGIGSIRNKIEGVYVDWNSTDGARRMTLDFVLSGQFSNARFWASERGDQPVLGLIDLSNPEKGIAQALRETALEVDERNRSILASFDGQLQKLKEMYGEVLTIPKPFLLDDIELLEVGLSMTAKALLYIASSANDIEDEWDRSAPQDLVAKTQKHQKPSIRGNAEKQLDTDGYVKIRVVGKRFAQALDEFEARRAGEPGGHSRKVTHRRRSHLRRQAYGPEHSLRKTIFISEVMVNPGMDEEMGRIYDLEPIS